MNLTTIYSYQINVSVVILNDVTLPEPDFILSNLSPEKDVTLIDGEGHLIVVRIVLKNTVHELDPAQDSKVLLLLKGKLLCS